MKQKLDLTTLAFATLHKLYLRGAEMAGELAKKAIEALGEFIKGLF